MSEPRIIGKRYPARQNDGRWMVVEVTGEPQGNQTPAVVVTSNLPTREAALVVCERGGTA